MLSPVSFAFGTMIALLSMELSKVLKEKLIAQAASKWETTADQVGFDQGIPVSVDGVAMPDAVNAADASCNRCHGEGPGSGGGD